MLGDSWWAELKRLSVRIMDKECKHMGSGVLYKHDEQNVFVLTAAHVVNGFAKDEEFLVECQPDKGEEHGEMRDKYTFCVKGAAVRSYYEPKTFPTKTYHENDAAVIKLDIHGRDWIANRKEAKFPPAGLPLLGNPVAGYGYPKGKSLAKGSEVEIISSASEPTQNAICQSYTDSNHRVEWNLGISVSDPYSDDETAGWSGCTLFLTDTEPMVMAGSAFAIYPRYDFKLFRGADMHYFRNLLKTGFDIAVNECTCAELKQAGVAVDSTCNEPEPSPSEASFCIRGAFDDFIDEVAGVVKDGYKLLVLYGPAGCGKTEVARAISERLAIDNVSYTIPFCPSVEPDGDDMKASILAASTITGAPFHGGSEKEREEEFERRLKILSTKEEGGQRIRVPRWIIIDDFYHPKKEFRELLTASSFNKLKGLGVYLICTTRYNPDVGRNFFEVPPLFSTWKQHRSALRKQISNLSKVTIRKQQFKKCYTLTGGNLLLADWTRKTLVWVDMKDILKVMKTGDCSEEVYFPPIMDERNKFRSPLKKHIYDLYDLDCLDDDKHVLALLQFIGQEGWNRNHFFRLMKKEQKERIVSLCRNGWCMIRNQKISVDPALKLTCRVRRLTPDQQELKELLGKMYNAYAGSKSTEHYSAIRAYYKAVRKAVPALFDDEMLQWHSEICGV